MALSTPCAAAIAGGARGGKADVWKGQLVAGGKYYYSRNGSTLVAFAVGGLFKAGNSFKVIGAHSDSPVLKGMRRHAHLTICALCLHVRECAYVFVCAFMCLRVCACVREFA